MSVLGADWEVFANATGKITTRGVSLGFLFRDGVTFDLITIPVCKRHPKPAFEKNVNLFRLLKTVPCPKTDETKILAIIHVDGERRLQEKVEQLQ